MDRNQPYIRIVEQPAPKAIRFRYKCEGRSAGSIPGVNSTSDKKTYPTIQICGYTGRVIIVVSCVYKDPETRRGQFVYRPHPHNLVGRDRCKNGVCTVEVNGTNPEYTFNNLGIQCVKRRDIPEELRLREQIKVDPYKTGFSHKDQPQSIELNAVRLCFQAFLYEAGKLSAVLPPEVSEVVYDKKAMSDLNIARISHFSGPVTGGTEIILLCEKVNQPSDIALVFYEKENNKIVWEATANILLVYKQVAIVAHTPPYKNTQSQSHHKVEIQLKRVVDDTRSMSCPFTYTPQYTDPYELANKKRKTLSRYAQSSYGHDSPVQIQDLNQDIKVEPKDKTPPHQLSSPPLQPYQYQDHTPATTTHNYPWGLPMDNMQGVLGVPGPSHHNQYAPAPWLGSNYPQPISPNAQTLSPELHPVSPGMRVVSPNMQAMSPNMQPLSPHMQAMSPHMQAMSPHMQAMSPHMQAMSPQTQAMSPHMQAMSPNIQAMSPNMQGMSPHIQAMSPNMQAMSPNLHSMMPMNPGMMHGGISPSLSHGSNLNQLPEIIQRSTQPTQPMQTCSTDPPSITGLLMERGGEFQLTSGDLSGLESLLAERGPDLSDSLNRLSTKDLLPGLGAGLQNTG